MGRLFTPTLLLAAAAACVVVVLTAGGAGAAAEDTVSPERPASLAVAARAPAAPGLISPADDAAVGSVPPFSWRAVRRAVQYEFQLSGDAGFRSTLASFATRNTSATIGETLFDGVYHWRVRGVDAAGNAGRWSRIASVRKRWPGSPALRAPAPGAVITYPSVPLVLRWDPAPHATNYEVAISSAPSLAGNIVTEAGRPIEVRGTSLAFPGTLSPGRYYWAVTPVDAGGLKGRRSDIRSFDWRWPSRTNTRLHDLWGDPDSASYVDPQFGWDPIPGAARYDVEVNTSQDFAAGSKVCCKDPTTGTSLSPTSLLGNNTDLPAGEQGYHWRVRAIDAEGNAGEWNNGSSFRKAFDDMVPAVPALRIRNSAGTTVVMGATTDSPIVDWDAVPGASSYEVQVVPWIEGMVPGTGGCDWAAASSAAWGTPAPQAVTGTAWTPLAFSITSPVPFTGFARETDKLVAGRKYCARVRARAGTDTLGKRVLSDWTTLGGTVSAAFTYGPPAASPGSNPLEAGDYVQPATTDIQRAMPLFTWRHVAGACGYFVAIARDENFTALVDVARTRIPAYAPRLRSYTDETTSYYWAVLPVVEVGGSCSSVFTTPQDNSPRTFDKRSHPPTLVSPATGANVIDQPTFRWRGNMPNAAGVEGAREYRLQVSEDPTFANLIDDVRTASTAFTSSSTYPADTQVFWRVRATDENGVGLNWSDTGTFRRRLRIPTPGASNPTGGEPLPVLSWTPVQGAISYGFHLEEPDGDKSDYLFYSTAAGFRKLEGLGTLRWQVRANFPKVRGGTVPGGYSPVQTFTRFVNPPPGARLTSDSKRVLLNWDPSPSASKYRVEFSETNSFTRLLDTELTPNTNYAPRMIQRGFQNGGRLYWRVAAVDERNNVGGFATGSLSLPKGLRVAVSGSFARGSRRAVTVSVLNPKNRPVPRARVTVRGAGISAVARRTGRRGTVRFMLQPRRRGNLTFTAVKRGYRSGRASAPVR